MSSIFSAFRNAKDGLFLVGVECEARSILETFNTVNIIQILQLLFEVFIMPVLIIEIESTNIAIKCETKNYKYNGINDYAYIYIHSYRKDQS